MIYTSRNSELWNSVTAEMAYYAGFLSEVGSLQYSDVGQTIHLAMNSLGARIDFIEWLSGFSKYYQIPLCAITKAGTCYEVDLQIPNQHRWLRRWNFSKTPTSPIESREPEMLQLLAHQVLGMLDGNHYLFPIRKYMIQKTTIEYIGNKDQVDYFSRMFAYSLQISIAEVNLEETGLPLLWRASIFKPTHTIRFLVNSLIAKAQEYYPLPDPFNRSEGLWKFKSEF